MKPSQLLQMQVMQYRHDPWGFVRFAFPWGMEGELQEAKGPRQWQASVLEDLGRWLRGSKRFKVLQYGVASGHGIGKSALVGMIIHWAMSTCPDCRVSVTANTGSQLVTKTIPEVSKWFRMAINAHWFKVGTEAIKVVEAANEKTWRTDFVTWSLENTEAFAGLHNRGKRIVLIFDEASSIPDKIWEVAEGALTDADTEIIWIVFGNPTMNTGRFRECFGKNKHRWVTRQIDSRTVEGTNLEQMEAWVRDYGEDSDFCRVRIRGEFPRSGSSQFISGEVVADARKRVVTPQNQAYSILSVDVARFGDNQTVIGRRQGLEFKILDKLRGEDTVIVGRRVIHRICTEQPRTCVIDGDGIGGGVFDYVNTHLLEAWISAGNKTRVHPVTGEKLLPEWFRLEEFHGGMAAGDGFMYFNRRAEVWGRMKDWLETGKIPDDAEMESDLTGPEYYFSSKGQIQLEKKEDMMKRGLASPDIGDCLAMSFAVEPMKKTKNEALIERIQAMQAIDPVEAHFMRLAQTEEKQKPKVQQYWE